MKNLKVTSIFNVFIKFIEFFVHTIGRNEHQRIFTEAGLHKLCYKLVTFRLVKREVSNVNIVFEIPG